FRILAYGVVDKHKMLRCVFWGAVRLTLGQVVRGVCFGAGIGIKFVYYQVLGRIFYKNVIFDEKGVAGFGC
ncbi:hypothetical protein, partial [Celeribacter marinus]|uniref:hypothetical protein n=1 Tax=Celeribacter marinus TaxID=1397108 RepID=UPI00316F247A